ncbi:MAG: clostripain-related cysteine peptidase [Bacteroidales bacterium]
MKKYSRFCFILASLGVLVTVFSGCEKDDDILPARTVLVYIIAENSLSGYDEENITDMMEGMGKGDGEELNLLVYQDNKGQSPVLWKIEKNNRNKVSKVAVKRYDEQNSVDPEVMRNVIREAFSTYPASEKGLILWSHGSGWLPSPNYTENQGVGVIPRKRAFGQDGDHWLELWSLRSILEQTGVHFNFLLFDACHMANVEVAYELRNVTDCLIASSAEIMGNGFPYATVIPLMNKRQLDLPSIGQAYMDLYDGRNNYYGGTISVINTRRLTELAALYRQILANTRALDNEIAAAEIQEFGRMVTSRTSYRNFFYDLQDYVSLISPAMAEESDALLKQIVLYEGHTDRFGFTNSGGEIIDIRKSCGLTVFIPQKNNNQYYQLAYRRLQWYEDVY